VPDYGLEDLFGEEAEPQNNKQFQNLLIMKMFSKN